MYHTRLFIFHGHLVVVVAATYIRITGDLFQTCTCIIYMMYKWKSHSSEVDARGAGRSSLSRVNSLFSNLVTSCTHVLVWSSALLLLNPIHSNEHSITR